ncbi:hypothetical protein CHELA40_13605 [Chelatococcus asaccharovorans]|nr:hypothetical protein CHELA40_13605 [Chelatococcus asaccharovorans]CAH1676870.1 hypothetical protein CHELA17_62017 [Chelatococcus asaccharovorans]
MRVGELQVGELGKSVNWLVYCVAWSVRGRPMRKDTSK